MAGNSNQVQSVLSSVFSSIRQIGSVIAIVTNLVWTNLVWLTNRLIRSIIALRAIRENKKERSENDG